MKYLLDTCVISEQTKPDPDPGLLQWLQNTPSSQLFLSVITVGELRKGITKLSPSQKKDKLSFWFDALLEGYGSQILQVDMDVAEQWGIIMANAESNGKPLPAVDSLIAALALANNLILVTRNVRDFEGAPVEILNPWSRS